VSSLIVMGNNDSLPPPPPPGGPFQPPQPPQPAQPVPPAQAQPAQPQAPLPPPAPYAPTQAVPMTQQMPTAFSPSPVPGKSKAPMVIVAIALAFGLGVGAYFVVKKDDKKVVAPGSSTTAVAVVSTTPDTFVITSPSGTGPSLTTLVPTGTDGIAPDITVTDDTKFFTVHLPGAYKTDTQPIDANGTKVAQVSGARDLSAYNNGHDETGVTVLGGPANALQAPADLVNIFDPGATVCTDRNQVSGVTTTLGAAEVLYIDGCGTNKSSKVVMAVQATGTANVFVVIAQGAGPANGALLAFAQAVLETIAPA
jgi:hypothetical protein